MVRVMTVNDVLDGHVEKISTRFRRAVESFASANGIAWVRFGKDDRKIDVMQPYPDRRANPSQTLGWVLTGDRTGHGAQIASSAATWIALPLAIGTIRTLRRDVN
jgi:hypothetical protein